MPNKVRDLQAPQKASSKPVAPPDLWEQLDELYSRHQASSPPGEGWVTAGEYASRFHISKRAALDRLSKLHQAGKLEKHQAVPRHQAYYRIPNGRPGR